ncbi:hypothetical protein [Thermaurantiacus tibetensis]|uniref:hypothetical protein n=1 Tax=Thermaurantiacus tibetensis TaxID=2759035 RepID=UPI001890757C|nr:hypothetical protein [Thermaurantiacus tibetensis]
MSGGRAREGLLRVRMTRQELEDAERRAKARGWSVSQLVRELLARADELLPLSDPRDPVLPLPRPRDPLVALTATLARLEAAGRADPDLVAQLEAAVERLVLAHASARTR